MRVILVKRNKIVHCGIQVKNDGELYKISVCNGIWDVNDKTSIGSAEDVTCKRCQKIIAKADKNVCVKL